MYLNNYKIILLLIIIIIFNLIFNSLYDIKEGIDYMMPNPEMVKDVRVVPETTRRIILSEIYDNVRKHEKLFSIYDTESYNYQDIKQDPNKTLYANIYNLFPILIKHDKVILKITKNCGNTYIPPDTLNKLVDGSLIKPLKDDLEKIKNYPNKSLMPDKETDPKVLEEQAKKYEALASKQPEGDLRDDLLRKAKDKRVEAAKKIVENDPPDDVNTPVDPDPRISQDEIDARLQMTTLYHIKKIVEYQDLAVKDIYECIQNYMKKTFSSKI